MSFYDKLNMEKIVIEEERKKMCKASVEYIRNTKNITAKEAVNKLFEEYGVTLPVPIIKIVKDAGFSVYIQDLPEDIGGYIVVDPKLEEKFNTDKIIVVNSKENNKRRRFTVAHEFGHYLFDFKTGTNFKNAFENNNTKDTPTEKLVNSFAAEFLMPQESFDEQYNKLKEQKISEYDILRELSDLFLTPFKSVEKRIKEVIR